LKLLAADIGAGQNENNTLTLDRFPMLTSACQRGCTRGLEVMNKCNPMNVVMWDLTLYGTLCLVS
jgi:hypothetical protein